MGGALGLIAVVGVVATQLAIGDLPGSGKTPAVVETLLGLLAFAGVGRVLLSLLPAGQLGSFEPRALATTWATSHLLGVCALGFTNVVLTTDLGTSLVNFIGRPAALLAPWLIILAARLLSLPGAIAPYHNPTREKCRGFARALPLLFALAAALQLRAVLAAPATFLVDLSHTFFGQTTAAFFTGGSLISPVFGWASWIATALLVVHGLASARRSPALRWLIGIAVLLTPFAATSIAFAHAELVTAMCFTGGAAFSISWLRHGDRRSGALAVIAFLSQILSSWSGLALAAFAITALVITTPLPSRKSLALKAGALWLFFAWPIAGKFTHQLAFDISDWPSASIFDRALAALSPAHFALLFPVFLLLTVRGLILRRAHSQHPADPIAARPGRELAFTLLLFALAFAALQYSFVGLPEGASEELGTQTWANLANLIVLPLAALTAGLAALRGEHS